MSFIRVYSCQGLFGDFDPLMTYSRLERSPNPHGHLSRMSVSKVRRNASAFSPHGNPMLVSRRSIASPFQTETGYQVYS